MAILTLRLITNDTYSLLYRYYTAIQSVVLRLSLLYSFTFNMVSVGTLINNVMSGFR